MKAEKRPAVVAPARNLSLVKRGAKLFAVQALFLGSVLPLSFRTAAGITFYISPSSGSDSNTGTSQTSAWKTFAHAIPRLASGDTLLLENGIYNSSNSGFPSINCNSGAANGTATAPITVQAQNERQAFIKGDGTIEPFHISNCSYWNIIGLHIEDGDFINEPGGTGVNGNVIEVTGGSHYYFAKNLIARSNRYKNAHNFITEGVSNSLIERNECYYNYRHCFVLYGGSSNNEVRLNYANSRGYWQNGPSGDYCGNCGDTAGLMNYGGQFNTFENNISENEVEGHNNEPVTNGPNAQNNTFYGEISLNDGSCFRSSAHQATLASDSVNIRWVNSVCIHPATGAGLWSRSSYNTTASGISVFGGAGTAEGVAADQDSTVGVPPFTFSGVDIAVTGVSNGPAFVQAGGATASIDYLNSYGNASLSSGGPTITHLTTANPAFGPCYAWIPAVSPLKGSGSGGADLGANVLYEYSNGVITSTPIWTSSGQFAGQGAIVSGLNDMAGQSLFDVGSRLNINQNGCAFPAGYGGNSGTPAAPAKPGGLRIQ